MLAGEVKHENVTLNLELLDYVVLYLEKARPNKRGGKKPKLPAASSSAGANVHNKKYSFRHSMCISQITKSCHK